MSAAGTAADAPARPVALAGATGRPYTALAFLVAPGVPAALAALALAGVEAAQGHAAGAVAVFVGASMALSFGGYLSALVIGVPIYLLIPRRGVIPPAAAILIGGGTAALPWTIFGVMSRGDGLMVVATATFGLGCVGGLAFSLVRDGWPRRADATAGEGGA